MIFHYVTMSNAAPICSDQSDGFVDASNAMEALQHVVNDYKHPCGLYSAIIEEHSEARSALARHLSSRAATSLDAGTGTHHWEGEHLFVDGNAQQIKESRFEIL